MAQPDLVYNGTTLEWPRHGTFKATSGLPGFQNSSEQAGLTMDRFPRCFMPFRCSWQQTGR